MDKRKEALEDEFNLLLEEVTRPAVTKSNIFLRYALAFLLISLLLTGLSIATTQGINIQDILANLGAELLGVSTTIILLEIIWFHQYNDLSNQIEARAEVITGRIRKIRGLQENWDDSPHLEVAKPNLNDDAFDEMKQELEATSRSDLREMILKKISNFNDDIHTAG